MVSIFAGRLLAVDPGRAVLQVGDLADRVGQRGDLQQALGHRGDGLRQQRQPVDEGAVVAGRPRRGDILAVGGEERRLVGRIAVAIAASAALRVAGVSARASSRAAMRARAPTVAM
ncbi:MAG: hypothetical protein V9G12_17790 [Microthrixaceae bacterium]